MDSSACLWFLVRAAEPDLHRSLAGSDSREPFAPNFALSVRSLTWGTGFELSSGLVARAVGPTAFPANHDRVRCNAAVAVLGRGPGSYAPGPTKTCILFVAPIWGVGRNSVLLSEYCPDHSKVESSLASSCAFCAILSIALKCLEHSRPLRYPRQEKLASTSFPCARGTLSTVTQVYRLRLWKVLPWDSG